MPFWLYFWLSCLLQQDITVQGRAENRSDGPIVGLAHCCMLCRVVRYRSLEEELTGSSCRSDALRQALSAEDTATNASLYILLRAVDQFYRKHRRCPGLYDQYGFLDIMHVFQHFQANLAFRPMLKSCPIVSYLL